MESFLNHYEVVLQTKGPVFVGSGRQLDKKEYILDRQAKEVSIFHLGKMFDGLEKRHLTNRFQQYLLGNDKELSRKTLMNWFRDNRVSQADYEPWIKYRLNCGDFMLEKGKLDINECIKDAYEKPYIPGSSIKGMLRTILLAYRAQNSGKKQLWKTQISGGMDEKNAKRLLKYQANTVEVDMFHSLNRVKPNGELVPKGNAVNDIMSGFIVSDSEPLSTDDLALCQKIDVSVDGKQNGINTLRECIKPRTEIRFEITIDSNLCTITKKEIIEAIDFFRDQYYNRFLSKFSLPDYPKENEVWLGGGCGFTTKTVINAIFEERKALETTCRVLSKQKGFHNTKDIQQGVSPHMLKCTRLEGKMYQFGKCELEIL